MTSYTDQSKEIEQLCKEIVKASKKFAKKQMNTNYYFGDLLHVICDLKEVNLFLGNNVKEPDQR